MKQREEVLYTSCMAVMIMCCVVSFISIMVSMYSLLRSQLTAHPSTNCSKWHSSSVTSLLLLFEDSAIRFKFGMSKSSSFRECSKICFKIDFLGKIWISTDKIGYNFLIKIRLNYDLVQNFSPSPSKGLFWLNSSHHFKIVN